MIKPISDLNIEGLFNQICSYNSQKKTIAQSNRIYDVWNYTFFLLYKLQFLVVNANCALAIPIPNPIEFQ